MRKHLVLATASVLVLAFGTGAWAAGDTATVSVSATVVGTCKFTSGGSVSFTLDPSTGSDVNGTIVQPTFWCTKGARYTLSDDDGLHKSGTTHRMKHTSLEEYIPYSFNYTASGTGKGPSDPITMDISSQVKASDYMNASAGSYSDTVTLTITP